MQLTNISILAAVLLVSSASAQLGAGPGVITKPRLNKAFDVKKLSAVGTDIRQISLWHLPGDRPGRWTAGLTMSKLSTAFGGNGTNVGVVMGVYDRTAQTFTPSKLAKNLSSPGDDFGLMIEPTRGLLAVLDHPSGPVLATRTRVTAPFGAPKRIQGFTASFVDPALGFIGGQLHIFYVVSTGNAPGLYMTRLDEKTPKLVGTPVRVGKTVLTQGLFTGTTHSPTPIVGADGDIEGLWNADSVGNDSDMYFSEDLDPTTPHHLVANTSRWANNGGVAGGELHFAESGNYAAGTLSAGVAWLLGDIEKPGGTVDITGAVAGAPTALTLVFLSDRTAKPFAIPGFGGKFGLNLAAFSVLGSFQHTSMTQRGSLSFKMPIGISKIRVPIQGLSIVGTQLTFTNTARIVIN